MQRKKQDEEREGGRGKEGEREGGRERGARKETKKEERKIMQEDGGRKEET